MTPIHALLRRVRRAPGPTRPAQVLEAWALVPDTRLRLPLTPAALGIAAAELCSDCAGTGISAVGSSLQLCACTEDPAEQAVWLARCLQQATASAQARAARRHRRAAQLPTPTASHPASMEVHHAAA